MAAAQVVNGPGGELRGLSCAAPPLREFEIHKPVSIAHDSRTATMIFDLGQNAAHVPQISVTGPAGSSVRIIPSEFPRRRLGQIKVRWACGGGTRSGAISPRPPTAWKRGRRNSSTSAAAIFRCNPLPPRRNELPAVKSIEGVVVQSSSEPVGEFECSNPLFNRIRKLVRWAQRSNMMSVMTDCPHREKLRLAGGGSFERPGVAL